MDQTKLQEQIAFYYSKLPVDAQEAFSSMKWMETLSAISKKYALKEEQIQTLGTETTLVLLGIIDFDEYERIIENELGIEYSSSLKILSEIDTSILKAIRPQLITTYEKNVENLVKEKYGSQQKLDQRFATLPKEVQVAISESNYQQALYAIAGKFKLSIDQMGTLEEVTTKVMIGVIHPDQYEVELGEKLGLPKEKTAELVAAVNEGVLKNIREIMKSHWNDNKDSVGALEDDVPIPPYKTEKAPNIATPKEPNTESGIYKNAGIEMVIKKEQPNSPTNMDVVETSMKDDISFMKSGVQIIADKLLVPTVSKSVTSDHSLQKIGQKGVGKDPVAPTSTIVHDQYHESIE